MQTFLPGGSNFLETALDLDNKRLLKQGVEAYQILRVNAGLTNGWVNHPACKMWRGHEGYLYLYAVRIYDEIKARGFKADAIEKISELMHSEYQGWNNDVPPPWLCDDRVMVTHRGRLFEKDPVLYAQFEPESKIFRRFVCCDRCDYFWPTHTPDYSLVSP
jgi:hypothetical protein